MAMLIYRHPVWFSSRYIIHELVSVLIYHSAIMHLWNCYKQVVLLCTGGAAMHRWCCYALIYHSWTHFCLNLSLVPLCIYGIVMHRWCCYAPEEPLSNGYAGMHQWCCYAPVVPLWTGGATISCWWHYAMAMLIMLWSLDIHCNESVGLLVLCTATALSFQTPEIKFWVFVIFLISNYTREMNNT